MISWKSPVAQIYVDFEAKNVPCEQATNNKQQTTNNKHKTTNNKQKTKNNNKKK